MIVYPEQADKDSLILPDTLEQCQAELTKMRREIEELNERFVWAAAQIDNIRKRTEREILACSKEAQRKLLRQFLEVLDTLERSMSQFIGADALAQGAQLTLKQFEKALALASVEHILVEPGDSFDLSYDEWGEVRQVEVDKLAVVEILQPGYFMRTTSSSQRAWLSSDHVTE